MTGIYDGLDWATFDTYEKMFHIFLDKKSSNHITFPVGWFQKLEAMRGKEMIVTCLPNYHCYHMYVEDDGMYIINFDMPGGSTVKVNRYTFKQVKAKQYKEGENSLFIYGAANVGSKKFTEIDFSTWNTKNNSEFAKKVMRNVR